MRRIKRKLRAAAPVLPEIDYWGDLGDHREGRRRCFGRIGNEIQRVEITNNVHRRRMPRSALIIVDVQNDFIDGTLALRQCPAGEDGKEVVPAINQLLTTQTFDQIVYTMDAHPPDHVSFKEWPAHCIAGTKGQKLHSELIVDPQLDPKWIIKKGTDQNVDSYSAFWDNEHTKQTDLQENLQKINIDTVFIVGLAFDICVYFTALDAAGAGFNTYIIKDCCRSTQPAESEELKEKMIKLEKVGVHLIDSTQVPKLLS